MMLDTSGLIGLAAGAPGVVGALAGVAQPSIPALAVGEFRSLIHRSKHQRREERWLRELIEVSVVLPIDLTTADHYAKIMTLKANFVRPVVLWYAALARQYKLTVISNDQELDRVGGIRRIGWFHDRLHVHVQDQYR